MTENTLLNFTKNLFSSGKTKERTLLMDTKTKKAMEKQPNTEKSFKQLLSHDYGRKNMPTRRGTVYPESNWLNMGVTKDTLYDTTFFEEVKSAKANNYVKPKKQKKFRNKSITKAKLLFIYIIGAGIVSFLYAISCVFTGLSFWFAALPYSLLIIYGIGVFIWKNWRMIWVFVQNVERGRLLMVLNNSTSFEYSHKMKVIEWIYPRKNSIRFERWQELGQKPERTKDETKEMRKKQVKCPQQLFDGVQKLILVRALIYAHENIQILDDELRGIMGLTDENIDSFDFFAEVGKCSPKK